jgi:hypothetical protein
MCSLGDWEIVVPINRNSDKQKWEKHLWEVVDNIQIPECWTKSQIPVMGFG